MLLSKAIEQRKSSRGFLQKNVPDEVLHRVFERAQRSPSWCNIQPWRVWVVSDPKRKEVIDAIHAAAAANESPRPDLSWPHEYPEPYGTLRRECGKALYRAMDIARDNTEARHQAWLNNFKAFDAPHVAFVGMNKRFGAYATLDIGIWLQSVLLLLEAEGVASCAQASLAMYPDLLRSTLGVGDEIAFLFGIAIGYEDSAVPANACRTDRAAPEANISFLK